MVTTKKGPVRSSRKDSGGGEIQEAFEGTLESDVSSIEAVELLDRYESAADDDSPEGHEPSSSEESQELIDAGEV